MTGKIISFAEALKQSGLKPLQFCRAVDKLTGASYSPTMPSRWIHGIHAAPPPAIALAVLLGRLPPEERAALTAGPPRKKYTRKRQSGTCVSRHGK